MAKKVRSVPRPRIALTTKVFIQFRTTGKYLAGIENEELVFTDKLGEAWLMFNCEWSGIMQDFDIKAGLYRKYTVTGRL